MKRLFGLVVIVTIGLNQPSIASVVPLISTFDNDFDGWSSFDPASHVSTGGNPDGWIRVTDDVDPLQIRSGVSILSSSPFSGDLSSYDGGTMSFDLQIPDIDATDLLRGYLGLSVGGAVRVRELFNTNLPRDEWLSFSIPFTAESFNASAASWEFTISRILYFEFSFFGPEFADAGTNSVTVGMDNIVLAVPEPSSAGLTLIFGVTAVALRSLHRYT